MNPSHVEHLDIFEAKLKKIEDKDLLSQLKALLERERKIGDAILINLREINSRRLYASLGYPSLFEMLVKYFGLSGTAAYQRIGALKLISSVPEAQDALFKGETNLSVMAATQSFIKRTEIEGQKSLTCDEKKEIFLAVKGKTFKEAQVALAEINPVSVLPDTKAKALTSKHTLLQVVLEQETLDLLADLKSLLSHEIPDGNFNQVLKKSLQVSIGVLRKKKGQCAPKGDVRLVSKAERSELSLRSEPQGDTRSRYISKDVRRNVFQRANGRCEFVGVGGRRCNSRHQLEFDHRVPWSFGGANDESNGQILCSTHNKFRVKSTHGFLYKVGVPN